MNINEIYPKKPVNFACEKCHFNTCNKKDYTRHLVTKKHIINTSQCISIENSQKNPYECICGKVYKENSGLWRHKKVCKFDEKIVNNTTSNDINYLKTGYYMMKGIS